MITSPACCRDCRPRTVADCLRRATPRRPSRDAPLPNTRYQETAGRRRSPRRDEAEGCLHALGKALRGRLRDPDGNSVDLLRPPDPGVLISRPPAGCSRRRQPGAAPPWTAAVPPRTAAIAAAYRGDPLLTASRLAPEESHCQRRAGVTSPGRTRYDGDCVSVRSPVKARTSRDRWAWSAYPQVAATDANAAPVRARSRAPFSRRMRPRVLAP